MYCLTKLCRHFKRTALKMLYIINKYCVTVIILLGEWYRLSADTKDNNSKIQDTAAKHTKTLSHNDNDVRDL